MEGYLDTVIAISNRRKFSRRGPTWNTYLPWLRTGTFALSATHRLQAADPSYCTEESGDSYTSSHYGPAVPNLGKQHLVRPPAQPPEEFGKLVISLRPEHTAELQHISFNFKGLLFWGKYG